MGILGTVISIIALVICTYLVGVLTSDRVKPFFFASIYEECEEEDDEDTDNATLTLKVNKDQWNDAVKMIEEIVNKAYEEKED